jgi:hypothetical protein
LKESEFSTDVLFKSQGELAALYPRLVRHGMEHFCSRDVPLEGDKSTTPSERRRQAACVTRKLRLLRAHGLIKKVPHSHRYLLTERGQQIVSALKTARTTSLNELLKIAA